MSRAHLRPLELQCRYARYYLSTASRSRYPLRSKHPSSCQTPGTCLSAMSLGIAGIVTRQTITQAAKHDSIAILLERKGRTHFTAYPQKRGHHPPTGRNRASTAGWGVPPPIGGSAKAVGKPAGVFLVMFALLLVHALLSPSKCLRCSTDCHIVDETWTRLNFRLLCSLFPTSVL